MLSLLLALLSFWRALREFLFRTWNYGYEIERRYWKELQLERRQRRAQEAKKGRSQFWPAVREGWLRLEEKGREYPVALALITGFIFLALAVVLANL